jgi:bisanhydrobacterioruberin hydratase
MQKIKLPKHITITVALVIHGFGIVGILIPTYKEWFIACTPINLILMTALLFIQQEKVDHKFWIFFAICFFIGFLAELVGVHTGFLFGDYAYGNVLGPKLGDVPILIGMNWFVVVYCAGSFMEKLHHKVATASATTVGPIFVTISIVIDGALIATLFDYFMEPVAISLGYWHWNSLEIPMYNFICWFMLSALLLLTMRKLSVSTKNHFAIHLLIIQTLFFLLLNLFL